MTPELRKEASELILHKRGIRINVQLHVIEADEEITLRSKDEIYRRLIALWSVTTVAQTGDSKAILRYLEQHQLLDCLSVQEHAFLLDENSTQALFAQFSHRQHAFIFLAWCAGLIPSIHLLPKPISLSNVLPLLPNLATPNEAPTLLFNSIRLQRKDSIMDWSDLLYRLHWAVRHAYLTNKPSPGNINADLVREWHQTVNWICCYDEENNWDLVSTETSA